MTEYIIKEEMINNILGYLGTKPYLEVAQLINGLQTGLKKVDEINKKAQPEKFDSHKGKVR